MAETSKLYFGGDHIKAKEGDWWYDQDPFIKSNPYYQKAKSKNGSTIWTQKTSPPAHIVAQAKLYLNVKAQKQKLVDSNAEIEAKMAKMFAPKKKEVKGMGLHHECGYKNNSTLKFACGGCEAMPWYPSKEQWHLVNDSEQHLLASAPDAPVIVTSPVKAEEGSYYQNPSSKKWYQLQDDVWGEVKAPYGQPKATLEKNGTSIHIAMNAEGPDSATEEFEATEDGYAKVGESQLLKWRQNFDRLREQRNDYRKQVIELTGQINEMHALSAKDRKKHAVKAFEKQHQAWLQKRKTMFDEPGLSKRARAARLRASNVKGVELMQSLMLKLGFEGYEATLGE